MLPDGHLDAGIEDDSVSRAAVPQLVKRGITASGCTTASSLPAASGWELYRVAVQRRRMVPPLAAITVEYKDIQTISTKCQ